MSDLQAAAIAVVEAFDGCDNNDIFGAVRRLRRMLNAAECPDALICRTCPCSVEDDVCFPEERAKLEVTGMKHSGERDDKSTCFIVKTSKHVCCPWCHYRWQLRPDETMPDRCPACDRDGMED